MDVTVGMPGSVWPEWPHAPPTLPPTYAPLQLGAADCATATVGCEDMDPIAAGSAIAPSSSVFFTSITPPGLHHECAKKLPPRYQRVCDICATPARILICYTSYLQPGFDPQES